MGFRTALKVQPSASSRRIRFISDKTVKVYLNSPPEKGRANRELVKYLSGVLGVAKSSVRIVSGRTGKTKTLRIEGISEKDFLSKINRAVDRT